MGPSYTIESQWGNFGTLLPPRGATLPRLRYGLTEPASPLQMWQISHFCEIQSLSYEASKFFGNVKSMRFFWPLFRPGANIVPPIAYKSHSTPFPIRAARFDTSFMAL